MKGYIFIFVLILAFIAFTYASVEEEGFESSEYIRVRRSGCEYNDCQRWCARLGFDSGSCKNNVCECDE